MNQNPTSERQARIWALHYMRSYLASGWTAERAQSEVFIGCGGPNEAGHQLSHGKLSVPDRQSGWTFRFSDLEKEIRTSSSATKAFEQEVFAF